MKKVGDTALLSVEQYYHEAMNMLEMKDPMGFMENISYAILLSCSDKEYRAKVTFLKAKGLYLLREYDKALAAIEEALKYNNDSAQVRLMKFKGLIFYYRGFFAEAVTIYQEALEQADTVEIKAELCINLAAAYLAMYRTYETNPHHLEQAHTWLKETDKSFELLQKDINKKLICINYGEYYYLIGDIDKSITIQEKAIQYCQEKDLPEVYNNLAELCVMNDCVVKAERYLRDVEILGERYHNKLEVAKGFYTTSKLEFKNEEYLKAIDSLYMALDYFMDAEALPYAFNCFIKILDVSKQFDNICVKSLKKGIKGCFKNTPFYEKM